MNKELEQKVDAHTNISIEAYGRGKLEGENYLLKTILEKLLKINLISKEDYFD